MKFPSPHAWDVTAVEAVAIQRALAGKVVTENRLGPVSHIAGVDLSVKRGIVRASAAVVVLRYSDLSVVDSVVVEELLGFPYVPGLLSFREAPAILAAFEKIRVLPDLVMVDGQGIAHPRRLGIASHLGLILDIPTIGCAKSRLVGKHEEPGPERGDWTDLVDHGTVIGNVLRTKVGSKPLFISIGHKIDLASSREWVLRCGKGFRLPEPTRLAHLLAGGQTEASFPK